MDLPFFRRHPQNPSMLSALTKDQHSHMISCDDKNYTFGRRFFTHKKNNYSRKQGSLVFFFTNLMLKKSTNDWGSSNMALKNLRVTVIFHKNNATLYEDKSINSAYNRGNVKSWINCTKPLDLKQQTVIIIVIFIYWFIFFSKE